MLFKDILGLEHIKNHLQKSVENGRIPHAQLFVGKEGCGTLATALAYAQLLLCIDNKDVDSCTLKCKKLLHPDLHFAFPVTTTDKIKKHPTSKDFYKEWRDFVIENPYANLFEWLQFIGVENKQGNINVDEAEDVVKKLQLKSYEGGYKIMIIWMAEKLNTSAANKLLKIIEEPPKNTVFILVAENEEHIINTIRSRCQVLHFPNLSEQQIAEALISKNTVSETEAKKIAHQVDGNYNKALQFIKTDTSNDEIFENWFVTWVRAAFKAKGNAAVIHSLIDWSDIISSKGRETQKRFLNYCLQVFRQSLLLNYGAEKLVYIELKTDGFRLDKFAPFIHNNNILDINKEMNEAIYHIERNGNAKVILLDLSIKLTRLLHAKP